MMKSKVPSSSEGIAEPVTKQYFDGLDGLRAIAVLAVLVYHFTPSRLPGGFVGVDLFFVLSGFLITNLLLRDINQTGTIDLKRFYIRRVRRLIPASVSVVLVVVIVTSLTGDPFQVHRLTKDALASILNLANWNFVYSQESYMSQFLGVEPSPLRHTWSLAVEEQFYLIWPILIAGVAKLRRRSSAKKSVRATLLWLILTGIFLSTVTTFFLFGREDNLNRLYFGTDVRAQQILVGALLAVLLPIVKDAINRRLLEIFTLFVSLPIFVFLFLQAHPDSSWLYQGGFLGLSLATLPIILVCVDEEKLLLGRILSFSPLVKIGRISYGLYLWHWPIFLWVDQSSTNLDGAKLLVARYAATFAVSLASYFIFEKRIRKLGFFPIPKSRRPLVAILLIISVLLLSIFLPNRFTEKIQNTDLDGSYSSALSVTESYYLSPLRCDEPPSREMASGWKIITIGNSLMNEVEPCLSEILGQHGATLESRSNNAAAICDIENSIKEAPITDFNKTLIVFFHLPFWLRPCGFEIKEPAQNAYYQSAVRTLVDSWAASGAKVLLVPVTPGAKTQTESVYIPLFHELESSYPDSITIGDSGRYLRSTEGRYLYYMPCTKAEIGCLDNGLIGVRLPADGQHFCSYEFWQGEPCSVTNAGGERRVATAIAEDIVSAIS